MKHIKAFSLKTLLVIAMITYAVPAFADDDLTPFDDDVQDVENEAPINGFIYLGMGAAMIIGYKALQNKKQL